MKPHDFNLDEFSSKGDAIRHLYRLGYQAVIIAEMVGAPRNSVNRCISEERKRTGYSVPVTISRRIDKSKSKVSAPVSWRYTNYEKSVKGAREALEAFQ